MAIFGPIIFATIFPVVIILWYAFSKVADGSAGRSKNVLDPVNEMWRKRAGFRCRDMEDKGVEWTDLPMSFVSNTSIMGLMRKTSEGVRVLGLMEMEVNGQEIQVFDVLAKVSGKRNPYKDGFQSFMTVTLTDQIDLPHFFAYPGGTIQWRTVTTYDEVQLTAMSMGSYKLEAPVPYRARALFDTDYAFDVLTPYIRERDWSVEWNGSRLLVYRWNELLQPEDVATNAMELLEFADLLKPAVEALQDQQDHEIAVLAEQIANA